MKKSILLGIGLALLVSVINLQAQYSPRGFALNSTGSTISSVIVPPYGAVSRVEYVNCKSDLSSSIIQFYSCTNKTSCLQGYTNSTVTLVVQQTNGFASGDIVVIQHVVSGLPLERRVLTTMTTATNLVVTQAPTNPFIPGDIVYQEVAGPSILLAAANVTVGPTPAGVFYSSILNGANTPILIDITGTSACSIYDIAGSYLY